MRSNGTISAIFTICALLLGFLAFVNSPKKVNTDRDEKTSGAWIGR
ncbi:MAG: hypothetical protein ACE1ZQ_10200 [Ignavibacteriaceae bacterium]